MHEMYGVSIPRTLADLANPREMALLVYDMQIGIVTQLKDGAQIVERVVEVVTAAREAGIRILYTRHLSLPLELMGSFQYRMAMAWQRIDDPKLVKPWFLRESPGFEIVPELKPRPSEAIFDKLAMSAFEGTPLEFALRDCGIRSLAIAGIALEIGIEPTAKHAADVGIIPVVVRDACGWGHEHAANRSIEGLEFGGDTILTDVATIRDAWLKR